MIIIVKFSPEIGVIYRSILYMNSLTSASINYFTFVFSDDLFSSITMMRTKRRVLWPEGIFGPKLCIFFQSLILKSEMWWSIEDIEEFENVWKCLEYSSSNCIEPNFTFFFLERWLKELKNVVFLVSTECVLNTAKVKVAVIMMKNYRNGRKTFGIFRKFVEISLLNWLEISSE